MLSIKTFTNTQISTQTQIIYDTILATLPANNPNFETFSNQNLRALYLLYDQYFFDRQLSQLIGEKIRFSLSTRMTRSAGKTIYYHRRASFEIRLSFLILLQNDFAKQKAVNGLACKNRLEAAMRIMEHELIHVAEFLLYAKSACGRQRFQDMAAQIFGHTYHRHQLVTPRQKAASTYGLKVGDKVEFMHKDRKHYGQISNITKRATVMIPDKQGLWKDKQGKKFSKFYVPLAMLKPFAQIKGFHLSMSKEER